MPDNAPVPGTNNDAPTPSSTPRGTPDGGTPGGTWKAGDNAPAWARGKSAEEILGLADVYRDALARGPAPEPERDPAPSVSGFDVADDEIVTGAQLKQLLAKHSATGGSALEMSAGANLGIARQTFSDDFKRYGGEIENRLAGVPKHLWTLDNITTVVKLIRSDHVDEIARERATQLAAELAPTIRSGGAPSPSAPVNREHSLDSEKIPSEWKRRALAAGITESVIADFCRTNDMTPADFYKQFDTPLNRIVEDIPQRRNA